MRGLTSRVASRMTGGRSLSCSFSFSFRVLEGGGVSTGFLKVKSVGTWLSSTEVGGGCCKRRASWPHPGTPLPKMPTADAVTSIARLITLFTVSSFAVGNKGEKWCLSRYSPIFLDK